MKCLVFERDTVELGRTFGSLRLLGHEVRGVSTAVELRQQVAAARPDIIFIDLTALLADGLSLVRDLRGLSEPRYLYICVTAKTFADDQVYAAYEAGCDAELRVPLSQTLLRSRLRAAERLSHLEVIHSADALPPAIEAPTPATPLERLTQCSSWAAAAGDIRAAAATFLNATVAVEPGEHTTEPAVVSGIALSSTELRCELRLAFAMDAASSCQLTTLLFGEDSPQLQSDFLGELANICMGAIKASYGKFAIALTGGLPEVMDGERFHRFAAGCRHVMSFALTVQGARVIVRIALVAKDNALVGVATLREGMVLAKDVYNARGTLLLSSGTRLSATAADRLRQSLSPKEVVEVALGMT